jgi:hypothetical protein
MPNDGGRVAVKGPLTHPFRMGRPGTFPSNRFAHPNPGPSASKSNATQGDARAQRLKGGG